MRISDWSSDVGSSDLSGGSWGANSSTAGLYAACEQLRAQIAQKAGFNIADAEFADGPVLSGNRAAALRDVAAPAGLTVEGGIEFGDRQTVVSGKRGSVSGALGCPQSH